MTPPNEGCPFKAFQVLSLVLFSSDSERKSKFPR